MIWSTVLTLLVALIDDVDGGPARIARSLPPIQQTVMRVAIRPESAPPAEWRERRGPKCLAATSLSGAVLSGPDTVDFLVGDQRRFRAQLDRDCPTLDFYGGFYLQPVNQWICAGRDEIRSRMGGVCQINRFRRLEARPTR